MELEALVSVGRLEPVPPHPSGIGDPVRVPQVADPRLCPVVGELSDAAAIHAHERADPAQHLVQNRIERVAVEIDQRGRQLRDKLLEGQPIGQLFVSPLSIRDVQHEALKSLWRPALELHADEIVKPDHLPF